MRTKIFTLLCAITVLFIACKKDECTADAVNAQVDKVNVAIDAYNADLTNTTKCKEVIKAIEDYIDIAEGCTLVDQADVTDAKAALASLPCN